MQHAIEVLTAFSMKFKIAVATFFKAAMAMAVAYLAPTKPLLIGIGVLIFLDLLTGIYKTLRSDGSTAISAKGFRKTADKLVLFPVGIVAAYVLEINWLPELPIMRISTTWFAITELKSIFENLGRILNIDVWAAIWPRIKEQFDKIGRK